MLPQKTEENESTVGEYPMPCVIYWHGIETKNLNK